ncbi:Lrp/AsnC family transcriptional regulator [Priestia koreensis]|uniref:AsnC family transcriptional regulator n=1 Tax=Priestia koreensis TaxID=284581 RepID=A0A0M0KZS9_9BACI|nr:Lrp/AsnC family transcriptional regulator [Priestia koreensis]KOO44314.1 AsnC family transcriptional regulator [Priestia koreensis]MCM3005208.1 Lrp/AsnC family transcriptional regulator [Priestia koreensis]
MDEIDQKILSILQEDGRISMTDLGKMINLSTPAVKERVKKLEERGVIEGYRAVINPERLGKSVLAYILVDTHNCKAFREFCRSSPLAVECHRLAGQYSYLVKLVARSVLELEEFIDEVMKYGKPSTLVNLSSPVKHKEILP